MSLSLSVRPPAVCGVSVSASSAVRQQRVAAPFPRHCQVLARATCHGASSTRLGTFSWGVACRAGQGKYFDGEVNIEEAFANSTFPVPPEELIMKAREFCQARFGFEDPSVWAEDGYVILPIVGPLPFAEFMKVFSNFNLEDAFSDFKENYFGWTVDPLQPNRVWFMSRATGTNDGEMFGQLPATGKWAELVPTMNAVLFNEEGKVIKFSTGYPCDREEGNSGGMSAAFGLLHVVKPGLFPIPEMQPYKPSWQFRLLTGLGVVGRLFDPRN